MPKSDLTRYQYQLRVWAGELAGSGTEIPIEVENVCRNLGLITKRSSSVGEFKSYLNLSTGDGYSAVILLPELAKPENINFERLCIAHELAHYLLITEYKLAPKTKSEYWQHEEICDDFARRLLVPDSYLLMQKKQTPHDLRAYLALSYQIASIAKIPWIHAATRVAEAEPGVIYLRCGLKGDEPYKPEVHDLFTLAAERNLGSVGENDGRTFIVWNTSLAAKKGVGTQFKPETALNRAFFSMLKEVNGHRNRRAERDITNEIRSLASELRGSSLKHLFGANEITAIAQVESGDYADIKVALGFVTSPFGKAAQVP